MALVIDVKVVPCAGRQQIVLDAQRRLKCFLKNAPERGKANEELIKLFAKKLGLARSSFEIIVGMAARHKKIKIGTSLSYEQVLDRLGLAAQISLL